LKKLTNKIIVPAGQLGLTGGAQPFLVFFPNPRKTSIKLLLEAQRIKKYAQSTPSNRVSSFLFYDTIFFGESVCLTFGFKFYCFHGPGYH
jgi:hypothetical protein